MTPVFLMDEHNDAFYSWNLFCECGYIPKENNYLLHIDHHDDKESGAYDADLTHMPRTAAEALSFTDRCLGIADFIVPAIFQGLFSTLHTLKNVVPQSITDEQQCIKLISTNRLICLKYIPFIHAEAKKNGDKNYKFFLYRTGGMKSAGELNNADSLVLDIDLDYFCWDDSLKSVPEKRIEITRQAYEEYCSDRNHPFRLFPRKLVFAKEDNGRYFLVYRENYRREPSVSNERIIKRIDCLLEWLDKTKVFPKAIDICRSSYSGYLPSDKAEFVEKNFLKRLGELYSLEFINER